MKICVFAASSDQIDQKYMDNAFNLAQLLAENGHELVYGGGQFGIMGAFARGFKKGGGRIIGIVPDFYEEIIFDGADDKIVTSSMSERKLKMIDMADAILCMEGGIGTYDELFEAMCMNMVETMHKPLMVYNKNGYFTDLLNVLKRNEQEKFIADLNSFTEVTDDQQVVSILEENK